jgi:hypothetical protein
MVCVFAKTFSSFLTMPITLMEATSLKIGCLRFSLNLLQATKNLSSILFRLNFDSAALAPDRFFKLIDSTNYFVHTDL